MTSPVPSSVSPAAQARTSMTAPLRRVLVAAPRAEALRFWREYGWRAEPDADVIAREHERFCALLVDAGAEVVFANGAADNPDAIYVHDPAIVGPAGAILLRPGKPERREEAEG